MRPTGVTLSAVFQFVRGGLVALYSLGVFLIGGLAARVAAFGAEGNLLQRILSGSGKVSNSPVVGQFRIRALIKSCGYADA